MRISYNLPIYIDFDDTELRKPDLKIFFYQKHSCSNMYIFGNILKLIFDMF